MSYIISIAILLMVLFFALKPKKKSKIVSLKDVIVPEHWHQILVQNVLFYKKLTKEEQTLFQAKMVRFLEATTIEAIHFELEELDRLLIAASAVIPVFRFPNWHYANLSTVLMYPD
ncbi:zinc-dependent peptidase [Polaribacter vadi]|uniref:zinc-dependent peptidase n=1 Tax=Polaribacter vadi TaxID=1774273 RepID=UPI000B046EFC|nr:zinc-dependent peptidase [Polaribacter vadi]